MLFRSADFLGNSIPLGFEGFDFGQKFSALFIGLQDAVNELLVPGPAGGEALTYKIGLFAD